MTISWWAFKLLTHYWHLFLTWSLSFVRLNFVIKMSRTRQKGSQRRQRAPLRNSTSQWQIAESAGGIVHIWVHIPFLAWQSGIWTHPRIPNCLLQLWWGHRHASSPTGRTGPLMTWGWNTDWGRVAELSQTTEICWLCRLEEICGLFSPANYSWIFSQWFVNVARVILLPRQKRPGLSGRWQNHWNFKFFL